MNVRIEGLTDVNRSLQRRFGEQKAKRILATGLNKTKKNVETKISKGVRQKVRIPAKKIKASMRQGKKANTGNLSASVVVDNSQKFPLIDFPNSKRRGSKMTVRVYKSGGALVFDHAFPAYNNSGIYQREGRGAPRFPIKQLYAPPLTASVESFIGVAELVRFGTERVRINIQQQVTRFEANA